MTWLKSARIATVTSTTMQDFVQLVGQFNKFFILGHDVKELGGKSFFISSK
jgi:hypothetical protein